MCDIANVSKGARNPQPLQQANPGWKTVFTFATARTELHFYYSIIIIVRFNYSPRKELWCIQPIIMRMVKKYISRILLIINYLKHG